MLKVSAFYLEKQKSFIPKKYIFQAVVNIKTKKLCFLTQFSVKVLLQTAPFSFADFKFQIIPSLAFFFAQNRSYIEAK